MPFVRLCDFDPAYDLVALIEKITVSESKEKSAEPPTKSPLAALVEQEKYTQLLEDGFFGRLDKILASSEQEIDASFSLCFSLLHAVDSGSVSDMILRLATALSGDHSSHSTIKLSLMCQLFNLLDTSSPLRITVFLQMLRFALAAQSTDTLLGEFGKIDKWLAEWKISDEQKAELYLLMSQCHSQAGSTALAKFYLLKYLKTFESASPARLDTAVEHAAQAAKDAVVDPTLLQCDGLLDLAAIKHLAGSNIPTQHKQIHELLSIFALGTVADFKAFAVANKEAFATLGLSEEDALVKIQRLSLLSLAAGRTSLSYEEVQTALQLADGDDVEIAVINAVGVGSLDAKLDQDEAVVHIRRVDQRAFRNDSASWGALGSQLGVWSANITSVLNHMAQNRHVLEDEVLEE